MSDLHDQAREEVGEVGKVHCFIKTEAGCVCVWVGWGMGGASSEQNNLYQNKWDLDPIPGEG